MKFARWRADLVLALISIAGFAFLYRVTYSFPPSPVRGQPGAALFPRAILIMLLVTASLLAIGAIAQALGMGRVARSKDGQNGDDALEFDGRTYAWTIAVIGAFCLLLDLVGFEATSLLIMSLLLYFALGDWTKAVVGAAVSTLVLYVVFVLGLGVTMPLAILPTFVNL